jgi:hypothetical protein
MKLKQNLRNVLCACVATIPLQLGASGAFAEAEDLTIIPQGETKSVTAHSVCQVISNGGGADIMAPHRQSSEWAVGGNAFLLNIADMDHVSVSECGKPAELVPDVAPFAYVRNTSIFPNMVKEKMMWNNLSDLVKTSGDFDDIASRYPRCVDQDGKKMSYKFDIDDMRVGSDTLYEIATYLDPGTFYKKSSIKNQIINSLNSFYDTYKGKAYIPENEDVCNMTFDFQGINVSLRGFRYLHFDYLLIVERE